MIHARNTLGVLGIVTRNKLVFQTSLLIRVLLVYNWLVVIDCVIILREVLLNSKLRSWSTRRIWNAPHLLEWIIEVIINSNLSCLFLFISRTLGCGLRNYRMVHFLHKSVEKLLSLLTVQNCLTYLLLCSPKILWCDILDWCSFSMNRPIFSWLIGTWS